MTEQNPRHYDCNATLNECGIPDCYPTLTARTDPAIPENIDLYVCDECAEIWGYDGTVNEWERDP